MIELKGVSVAFEGAEVLGPLDLELEAGAFLGLIGPPASGKSLLLKVIAGLVRPTTGTVRVLGAAIESADPVPLRDVQRKIGMVFQNNALFDSRTIFENVAFPLRRRAWDAAGQVPLGEDEVRRRVTASLAGVGLAGTEDRYPHELSGGMQKRAGIARATVFEPRIRLFDEPTAGLDPVTSARILALIRSIHFLSPGQGVSIIISNDVDTMLPVVPRVVMLHRGRVVFDGPRADLDTDRAPSFARRFVRGDVNTMRADEPSITGSAPA